MHRARYTYSNGGRNDFGGWKLAGKIRQRDLTKAIKKKFRENAKEIRRLQGAFLEKWNRETAEADDDSGVSKKRKAAAAKEAKKKQKLEEAFDCGGWGESDDSDEESDIGSESEGDS